MRGFWPARNDISVKLNRDLFSIFVSPVCNIGLTFVSPDTTSEFLYMVGTVLLCLLLLSVVEPIAGQAEGTKPQKRD
ncbi:hypothetical protein DLM46_36735 [Paraburkholderia lacunae]|uniref:Uncharacterized protein n=1 Tax=Paraburkholderia lacunae TaxID=2211104 RepID=A0A370MWC9_9BURK|nr:hypothetical protein DLM46_36735 [Paraburkholderia lacunae]